MFCIYPSFVAHSMLIQICVLHDHRVGTFAWRHGLLDCDACRVCGPSGQMQPLYQRTERVQTCLAKTHAGLLLLSSGIRPGLEKLIDILRSHLLRFLQIIQTQLLVVIFHIFALARFLNLPRDVMSYSWVCLFCLAWYQKRNLMCSSPFWRYPSSAWPRFLLPYVDSAGHSAAAEALQRAHS